MRETFKTLTHCQRVKATLFLRIPLIPFLSLDINSVSDKTGRNQIIPRASKAAEFTVRQDGKMAKQGLGKGSHQKPA
jgi:hypothetical protein